MPRAKTNRTTNEAATPAPMKPRQALLKEAFDITSVDRNNSYGEPEDNFQHIADRWNLYLGARFGAVYSENMALTSQDVGHMMIDMKLARLSTNPNHRDSLVDIAGYAACAEDCRIADGG